MSKPFDSSQSFVGEYNFRYILLHSYKLKDSIDITNLFCSMEVFESIYTPFMSLKLTLIDSIGLMEKIRFTGDEFIELDIRGPDDSVGIIGQTFFVSKVTDREYTSDRALIYTLHCISTECLADLNTKISKSYNDYPHNVAEKIITNQLMTTKEIYVEPCKNKIQYISNYWSPLQNLKFLTDRSVSTKWKSPAYVFYETKKSMIFSSLAELTAQPATHNFFYSANTKLEGFEIARQNIIDKMYVDESLDYITRLKSGAYGNRSLIINPFDKRYRYRYYDFLEAFDEFPRLNESAMSTAKVPRELNSKFMVRTAPTLAYPFMDTEKNEEWFNQRPLEHAELASQTYQIDLPGKFGIYSGNIANMFIYSSPVNITDTLESVIDKQYSGRYMITAINHYFDMESHKMSLQMNTDSLISFNKEFKKQ